MHINGHTVGSSVLILDSDLTGGTMSTSTIDHKMVQKIKPVLPYWVIPHLHGLLFFGF